MSRRDEPNPCLPNPLPTIFSVWLIQPKWWLAGPANSATRTDESIKPYFPME